MSPDKGFFIAESPKVIELRQIAVLENVMNPTIIRQMQKKAERTRLSLPRLLS
ncbi:MAG: hypothetical protein ACLR0U_21630 [Enterocloster clostridioformis]